MTKGHVVIVGSGIVGIAHALAAHEAGWNVTVLERDGRPLGASIRNFGTIWPIGCTPGPERQQALEGARRWRELAALARFPLREEGSLSLAYRDESREVIEEFARLNPQAEGFTILEPSEVARRFPAARLDGLRGALHSSAELVVSPSAALPALVELAQGRGIQFHFGTPAIRCHADGIETSSGQVFRFDHLVVAAGDELRLLFPAELAAAQVTRCRLQMMRTSPQPAGYRLGAVFVSDLTLCHYPAFQGCRATPGLRDRLDAEMPQHRKWGIHVIAAQHHDGSLILGDSHEYADDFPPESRADVDELILEAMHTFVQPPAPRLAARWQGIYTKSTAGQTQVVLRPSPEITLIAALGGLGMTLSWGLARQTVARWTSSPTPAATPAIAHAAPPEQAPQPA